MFSPSSFVADTLLARKSFPAVSGESLWRYAAGRSSTSRSSPLAYSPSPDSSSAFLSVLRRSSSFEPNMEA